MRLAGFSRALRTALGLLVGVVVLLALIGAGLWWWSGSEGSLDWTLRRVTRSLPLTLEGVSGSLRDGLRVQRVEWKDHGLRVEAREVHLEWRPQALVTRTLQLRELDAASVLVVDERPATGEPLRLPASLGLPLRVVVDAFRAGRIEYRHGMDVQLDGVAGRYGFDGLGHELQIDRLRWAKGRYSGRLKIAATGEMALDAQLRGSVVAPVPGAKEPLPLEFTAQAKGPLRLLDVRAVLDAHTDAKSAPHADVVARIAPFEAQPLPQASAQLRRVDIGAFWPQAPATLLSGHVQVRPAGTATWAVSADLANDAAGPWDEGKLPARQVRARGEWHAGTVRVRELLAQVASGEVRAEGEWRAGAWTVEAEVRKVDPAAIYGALAPMTVSGKAKARQHGNAIDFDVDLNGQPRPVRAGGKTASGTSQTLAALQLQQLLARGDWSEGTVSFATLRARASDAVVQGRGSVNLAARSGKGHLEWTAPGFKGSADGEISAARGGGKLQVQAGDLAAAQQWLRRWPGVPAAVVAPPVSGQAHVLLGWQGGWNDPTVQGAVTAAPVQWGSGEQAWTVREAVATVNGRLRDAQLQLRASARQGSRTVDASLDARGGKDARQWTAAVSQLRVALHDPALGAGQRQWVLQSRKPFDLRWRDGVLQLGAGEAALSAPVAGGADAPAVLAWEPARWGGGELQTRGRLTGLPMAWLSLAGGAQLAGTALSGDLVFDGQWDATVGRTLRVDAKLQRVAGDIDVLAEDTGGTSRRVRAGVREAFVQVQTQGERLQLTARWNSERAGSAQAVVSSRLSPADGGWSWPAQAPLQGQLRAELPRIGIWSLLAPPGWRLRGSVHADVGVGGTRSQPLFSGVLAADDLALRSVVDGIELRDGRMRLRLDGERLRVEEFVLHGGGEGGGTLTAQGEGRWTQGGPELSATVRLDKLRASIRSDRRLTVSGQLDAQVDAQGSQVGGELKIDEALIVVPEESAPKLGEDVVVRNAAGEIAETAQERKKRPPPEAAPGRRKERPLHVAMRIDLGSAFRVRGRGIDTRLAGTLDVAAESVREPRLTGTLHTVGGEYRAYGQRLDIERGVIRFTGAPDNPALDLLAIRPHMEQRVGVLVTGRAQSPTVRLYSEPEMADAEKLSLLVTGQSTPGSGAEAALVQQAALALLASRGGGGGGGIAGKLGLDQLSVRRGAEGPMVALGKRFSRNVYASFERSLSGGLGTLYVFYEISRRLKVRAEAGEASAVDLIFTFGW